MIVLRREDLGDQQGMERALREYFTDAAALYPGRFNTMLDPAMHSCDYRRATVTLVVRPRPWMGNPMGNLHGGVSAAALDMTMGLLCRYFSGGYMTPTISMDTQFLRPGPLDRPFYIQARLLKRGRQICRASGSLWAEGAEDKPLVTATGTYFVAGPASAGSEVSSGDSG